MKVLTVNAGSGSLKISAYDGDEQVDSGSVDAPPDGEEARDLLRRMVSRHGDVDAVGHRIVHGGRRLTGHAVVDDDVRALLDDARDIDPQHVPPALAALDRCRSNLPGATHVACLDTAFHATMPTAATTYAVPTSWRDLGVRRYGFHGLSYAWAARRAAELLGRSDPALVLAHVGGGTSVCASLAGQSMWTSMGFTSLEGAVMVGRSGSVDPGALLWLLESQGLSLADVRDGLQTGGGLRGLAGGRDDTRELEAADDEEARLALDVFVLRLRQEIAAAAAVLPRVDALVLTGEIATDSPAIRQRVCDGLAVLSLDGPQMGADSDAVLRTGPPAVLLVQTGEEPQIARICHTLTG